MNGGRNYNGPKVQRCLREIRLSAGISEHPVLLRRGAKRTRQAAGEGESRAVLRKQ